MRHFDRDAREILADLQGANPQEAFVELMWSLRYPKPSPKSSNGWPFRRASEMPAKAIRVVK